MPRCVVYARVSSGKQAEAGNLDRQRERLVAAAAERRYKLVATVTERASGLNEKRKGLRRLSCVLDGRNQPPPALAG